MENGKIRPRADPKPLNRLTQNLKQMITSARRSLCKISCKSVHWGLLGKWVKYNENFSSIYLVLLTDLQIRPPGGFSRAMARTTRPHAKVKPFREPKFEILTSEKFPQSRKLGPKTDLEIFGQKRSCIKISPINDP